MNNSCICLGSTGNIQESHWLLNLCTERHFKGCTFTPLPAPPYTIARVHELADENNQKPALDFCNHRDNLIENSSLADPTITGNDSKIAVLDIIGFNNAVVEQLENEHQKYEIAVGGYENKGEISGVDQNMPAVLVDIPLGKIPEEYSGKFEEECFEGGNPNATMPPLPPTPPPA